MEAHYKALGWIFVIVGLLSIILGLAMTPILISMGREIGAQMQADIAKQKPPDAEIARNMIRMFKVMWVVFALLWLASSVVSIINGWGLLSRRPWARILTIILSILAVTQFPIGTAIGVYGLWAMFQSNAPLVWDQYVRGTQRTEMPAG